MPWPPGLVLKNGVNRLACASGVSPAPLSSISSLVGDVLDVARMVIVPGPATRLEIEDSGPGLTPEAQANLFTPFFSTKATGQGIGLTLVGEILAGHGFDYALERTDRGTTAFRIAFR